jgi:hypothetical protein
MALHLVEWRDRRGADLSMMVDTDAEAERQCRVRHATGCTQIQVDGVPWTIPPPQSADGGRPGGQ